MDAAPHRPGARRLGLGYWSAFEDDEFVGWFCLTPRPERRTRRRAGLPAAPDGRGGEGLATEGATRLLEHGFETARLERIWAETMAVNVRSRAVLERLGCGTSAPRSGTWDDPLPGAELGEVVYELTARSSTEPPVEGRAPGRLEVVERCSDGGVRRACPTGRGRGPTPPAAWNPAVESVAVFCQVVGSVVPAFHTRARTVVGEVPVTWTRISSCCPAAIVMPGDQGLGRQDGLRVGSGRPLQRQPDPAVRRVVHLGPVVAHPGHPRPLSEA